MSFEDDLAGALAGAGYDPWGNNTNPPLAGAPSLGGLSTNQNSGKAILLGVLRSVGLDTTDAAAYVTQLITGGGSISDWQATMNADLYDPSTTLGGIVKQKYPAIFTHNAAAVAKGLPTLSVGDYLSTKQQNQQLIEQSGLAPYVDKDALADSWITGFTSPKEASDRINAIQQAIYQEPPEVRAQWSTMFGSGADSIGAATAYFLDPTNSVPKIQQQLRAAEIGGASTRSGFGLLTAAEASQLAAQGVTADQAQSTLGTLAGQEGLFAALPGDTGGSITREQQLAAGFSNDAAAQAAIDRQRQARLAVFGSAAGGWNAGQQGVGGLGSASA